MKRFLERHHDRISGTLSGFDRMLYRGTLRSITHVKGLEIFLYSHHILMKNFGSYVISLSQRLVEREKPGQQSGATLCLPARVQGFERRPGAADRGARWRQTRADLCVCLRRAMSVV
jgi:hypothetical protein